MLAIAAASPGDGTVTVFYILIGIVTVLGGGGAIGLWRSNRTETKRQAVRDERIDRVCSAVLGDEQRNGAGGIMRRLDAQDRKLDDIQREQKPNGGDTQRLGDIAKRTETKVDEVKSQLDIHIGQSGEVHDELRRRASGVERRLSVIEGRPA